MQLAELARCAGGLSSPLAGAISSPVHVHDHSWGAKSALRAIKLRQIGLNRVVSVSFVSDAFYGCYFPPVARQNWHQALSI